MFINGVKKYTTVTDSVSVINLKADSSFSVAVRAFDSSGNASALSVPLTVKAASAAVTGLNYRYYEGTWTVLPDFNKLTSIKLGVIPNIDLSVSNVANNYGVVWEGYINIPVSGTYTFETISDDGSKLYFNSLYSASANNLVNNDGLHPSTSVAAAVSIPSAGLYPIAMTFFQAGGGASMQAFWSGPGITRQLIPSSVLFQNPSRDTSAPSVPQNLRVVTANTNQVRIVWDNSVDNTAVTGYDVFINGIKKYTTVTDSIIITNLLADSTFSVAARAVDSSGNASALSAPITVKAAVVALSGLKYRYYEGPWTVLPDFNKLTAIKSGVTGNVDLSVSNVAISYGIVWEGYINMPAPGTYTFETVSDDGSKFYFNSQYVSTATATVNNDGLHSPQSVTATVNVTAAGLYPIAITFFQAGGGASMQAYWSSASIARQLIPNSAFVSQLPLDTIAPSAPVNVTAAFINNTFINLTWNASTDNVGVTGYDVYVNGTKKYTTNTTSVTADSLTAATSYVFTVKAHDFAGNASPLSTAFTSSTTSTATGLTYKYYEGSWTVLPDFSTLTLVKTGITPNVDITVRPAGVINNYALLWQGNLTLPVTGTYTFETISDDGSKLYFNQNYSPAATALVNNDGVHGAISATGSVTMAAGVYPVTITYFQQYSGQSIQVYWSGPGIPRQLIPNTAFTGTYTPAVDTIAPSVPANVTAAFINNTFINLTWNASTDNVGVTGYDVYVNGTKKYTTNTTSVTADSLTAATSYVFTVKAHDFAGNASPLSTAFTSSTTSTATGLTYKYYEGSWTVLPDFSTLTLVKTGITPNVDITVRPAGVINNYALLWQGNLTLPVTGTYTFETISDDGSKLYFNQNYSPAATALVNNDGVHGAISATGSVTMAAGVYPVTITYFQQYSGQSIQVYWSGPGIPRQLIPNTAFTGTYTPAVDTIAPSVPANVKAILTTNTYLDISWDASTDNIGVTGYDVYVNNVKNTTVTSTAYRINGLSAGTSDTITIKAHDLANNISAFSTAIVAVSLPKANGLKYRYYEGTWNVMPNFDTLTAIKTGSSQTPDISIRPSTVNNYFGFVWEGYINITTPGTYTFETISDDGSKFYFNTLYNSAATPLVNNDGLHAPTSVSGGVNIPTAGLYPIAITYFQKDGGAIIQVYYSGPGITRQPIPGTSFSFSGDGTTQAIGSTTNISGSSLTIVNGTVSDAVINAKITRAYPNPFTENLTIQYSNTIPANNVSVAILDMSGKLVQRQILGNTFIGVSTFTINLDKQLKTGIYLVRLDIDGKRFKMWKMVKQNK